MGVHFTILALQQRGPASPFGDLLGYLIIFFVIIWPILRGLLEAAGKQRKEFEQKQRKAGPLPKRSVGRTIEDILEGKLEQYPGPEKDAGRAFDDATPKAEVMPPPRPPKARPKKARPAPMAEAAFGDRPASESSAPIYGEDDLFRDTDGDELGADPFDESLLERDLVPDSSLREVPTEEEIERLGGTSSARDGAPLRPVVKRPSVAEAMGTAGATDPEELFRRTGTPLSPWQRAFVLKEILGPPVGSRGPFATGDIHE